MLAERWLELTQPGFQDLDATERSAVAGFSIVWSVFEAEALSGHGNANSICRFVDENAVKFEDFEPFREAFDYFKDRYVESREVNHRFESLNFRGNDKRDLVEAVLLGEEITAEEALKGLLIVVYRLRNNLFHGLKWAYQMRHQQQNFEHAVAIMTKALDRCRGY